MTKAAADMSPFECSVELFGRLGDALARIRELEGGISAVVSAMETGAIDEYDAHRMLQRLIAPAERAARRRYLLVIRSG